MEYKHSLWKRLESEVLPFVSKPGRYIGNELNAIHKAHNSGILKIALCFPEMYEIGMSYMGMQILYHIINKRADCLAERAFTVWPDMEEALRKQNIPLFSLESSTPLCEFDVLGFHLTYEMTFTTALNMLNLAGIPLHSRDRNESHPLILAGGPSVLNPEPMADFVDAFFVGDAEEAIDKIIDTIAVGKAERLPKENILLQLAKIPGITCVKPDGAFYVYPNVSAYFGKAGINSAAEVAKRLLHEAHVVTVPGEAFGTNEHIRLSYATSSGEIVRGLERMRAWFAKL